LKSILRILVAATTLPMLAACSQGAAQPAGSSAATAAAQTENVEQLLAKMEQDWVNSLVKGDAAFTESILADDYIGIGSSGRAIAKHENVEDVRTGAYKAESMSIDNVKVRQFGDVAVVTYHQVEKSQTQGKDSSGRTLWTDIFVKRNGKWQIDSNHGVEEVK